MTADVEPARADAPTEISPLDSRGFRRLLSMQACFGLSYSVFLILPKYLTTRLGADAAGIGIVMGAFGVGNILATPLLPWAIRRLGRRRALITANVLMLLSAVGFLFVRQAGPLAAGLRILQGLSWALSFTAGTHLCAALAPPGRLVQAIALHSSSNLITNAVGPVLAEALLASAGAWSMFVLAAGLGAAGVGFARRLEDPVRPPMGGAVPPGDHLARGRRRFLVVTAMLHGLAVGTMFSFHQPLAIERGATAVSGFLVAYTVTAVFVRTVGARVTLRWGVPRIVFVSFLAYGLVVAGTAALSPETLLLFGGLFGIVQGFFYPSFMSLALESAGDWGHDRMLGWVNVAFNLGMVGVAALGFVSRETGYPSLFLAAGAVTVIASAGLAPPRKG